MPPQSNSDPLEEDSTVVFAPREQLINTAVKFLQNPRVRPSSVNHKRKFLKHKGLTDDEIDLAFNKIGGFMDDQGNGMTGPVVVARPYYEKPSLWIKAKDVANLVALFSIGSYSLYSLWKRYIAPSLFGTRSRNERNYEVLLEAIVKLNQNVIELKELIRALSNQSSLQKSRQPYEMQEIKNELSSIKALLLNRSQFPTSPAGIPSWQMLGGAESVISDDQDHGRDISNDNSNGNETTDSAAAAAAARRRKSKSQKSQRKSNSTLAQQSGSQGVVVGQAGDNPVDPAMSISMTLSEADSSISTPGTGTVMRKHPSVDSNNGFHSGSSCEVVFVGGKNDTDHSDD